jgi:hypothetical protein
VKSPAKNKEALDRNQCKSEADVFRPRMVLQHQRRWRTGRTYYFPIHLTGIINICILNWQGPKRNTILFHKNADNEQKWTCKESTLFE